MKFRWRISQSSRLIDLLKERLKGSFSARFLKRALESNICRVNGRVERFASAVVHKGDIVEIEAAWEALESKRPSYSILYEDEHLLVIDKPAGLICSDQECKKAIERPLWLAHRLDKDTTGVLLFGKNQRIAEELQECFEKRAVEKSYLAFVDGAIAQEQGVIESYLVKKRSFQGQTIWGASPSRQGLYAKTMWSRLASNQDLSLLQCRPETGRTHQIRVHLAQIGHPILVDRQYATSFCSSFFATRPLLHAHRLQLEWRQRTFRFEAPLPQDFQEAMISNQFSRELILT